MTTLAEVEVAIKVQLDPLLQAQKKVEQHVNTLDRKLANAGRNATPAFKAATNEVNKLGIAMRRLALLAGTAFSVKEIADYADAWTRAGNKIRSAEVATGTTARSLQDLNRLANQSRSGFTETVDLYSKLLRATDGVAKSELEVAQATDIVNKAFKAGGAAASEQRNAILQLGQALGSGVLQGDELRSIRENAPVLARAIAAEFNTTVAGLKKLGAEGELTADRVFKAILKAGPEVDKQFVSTSSTIAEGLTKIDNALTEFSGAINTLTQFGPNTIKFFDFLANSINNLTAAAEKLNNGDTRGGLERLFNHKSELAAEGLKDLEKEAERINPAYKALERLNEQFDALIKSFKEAGNLDAAAAFENLQKQLNNSEIKAEDAKNAIKNFFNDPLQYDVISLGKIFDPLLDALAKVEVAAKLAKDGLNNIPEDPGIAGRRFQAEGTKSQAFIDKQIEDSKRTAKEIAIDTEAKKLKDAAKEAGVALTDAAAKIMATTIVANKEIAAGISQSNKKAFDVIADYEKFREKAYWDKNHYRAGYGSDTTTRADGTKETITSASIVSLADATRDLERRIGEFQEGIKKAIGADTFASFNEEQQAALTSIAYNYGSLPERIVKAIKTGNEATIVDAIRGLGSDNGGINKVRRNSEADLFLGGSSSGVQDSVRDSDRFKERLADKELEIQALNRQAEALGLVNPLINDYGYAMTKAEIAQKLLNDAQDNNIEITPELRDQIDALAEKYAKATANANSLKEKNEELRDSMQGVAELGKSVLSGFISDIREGKTATEALANALNKVADKILEIGLDMLFGTGAQQGKGSLFGSLLKGLFGGFFAEGGRPPMGKASIVGEKGPEVFVPNSSGVIVPNDHLNPKMGGGTQKISLSIDLNSDDSAIAGIADIRIKNAVPSIVQISVTESGKQTQQNMPGYMANAQTRSY